MLGYGSSALARARILMTIWFYHFGIHCATHQIRIILISCVVITSLFYPALAIYSSSQPHYLAASWILRSLTGNTAPALYAQSDLYNLWTGHDALRVREDAVSRARCGVGRTLRVERILIQSVLTEEDGALNHQILLSTLQLEHDIAEVLSSRDIPCLERPNGRCFVISPLAFWHHEKQILMSDSNILDTLSQSRNVSVAGIPITPHMVLAGRESNEHISASYAMFLALTYFFPETDCLGNSDHDAWLQLVKDAVTERVDLNTQAQEPALLALEYDTNLSTSKSFSAISTFLYLAYTGFFAYVTWSMRRMDAVHSRIGLTFTALVEIAVSTVTSLSVCALVGFKVTMVPWELLPVVIVFVGAENMFNLVDAVGKTSVALPVKQRIAEGLKRAGTSNTLKVVSYNAILGVIAVLSVGAIRQFCAFAIVVLVAHWFLAHTFFMAVLSIDIQRLELDELLRQNASLVPSVPNMPPDPPRTKRLSTWQKLINVTQNILRSRANKNISLFLLLAITGTLYYTTYPTSNHINDDVDARLSLGALGRKINATGSASSPAWQIWKTLNPMGDPLLHLRVEMPMILAFRPDVNDGQLTDHKVHRLRSMRTLRLLLRLVRIVILPIAATTGVLYGLLLYLLKNAELLEAQRNRGEPDSLDDEGGTTLEGRVSFSTLPRACANDVELIAVSKNGQVVASVSLQYELMIWHVDRQLHVSIDHAHFLLRASTSASQCTPTSLALDDKGQFCAVGTGDGIITVWAINEDSAQPLPHLTLGDSSSRIVDLQFLNRISPIHVHPPAPLTDPKFPSASGICLAAVYGDGIAVRWALGAAPDMTYFSPSRPRAVTKSILLRFHNDEQILIAHAMEDGTLELTEVQTCDSFPVLAGCLQAGRPSDVVIKAHACCSQLGGSSRLIIGAVTQTGVISVWDAVTNECIVMLDEIHGDVTDLRISPVPCETCRYCGDLPLESFCISFSAGHIIFIYKVCISVQTRRCSCLRSQFPSRDIILDRHSRSNSISSSINSSPSIFGRARLSSIPPLFETSLFPVSGHGVHSRRATEKDSMRRNSDAFTIPFPTDDSDNAELPDSPTAHSTRTSIWKNVILMRVAEVPCDRGCWDVSNGLIMGVRRKPRLATMGNGGRMIQATLLPSQGLTTATLERWELWTFDPSVTGLQNSALVSLVDNQAASQPHGSKKTDPRLPFTRVSPLLISRKFGLAGFGNTVGLFNFYTT